jgi:hypothetical protein
MRIKYLFFSIFLLSSVSLFGQDAAQTSEKEAAYTRTINTRAEKIVATLELADPSTQKKVVSIIADQYRNLNTVYTQRDEQVRIIKEKRETKEATDEHVKKIEQSVSERIAALHTTYLSSLSSSLSPQQVTNVKDGMTYNVLNVTYRAYVDMIPTLKNEQKEQIMAWLVEAREIAMDAESSEKKHWWFGKYKGRINNYLSAQGYDIKKERQDWEVRKKANQSKAQ